MINNLYNLMNIKNKNVIKLTCPSCGYACETTNEKCPDCSYDLREYKELLLSSYFYFDSAFKKTKENDLIGALIDISKFLAYCPLDEDGNKLFIYLLIKTNNMDKAEKELEAFEEKFPRNPWIMEIEQVGIENIELPKIVEKNIINGIVDAPLKKLANEYVKYRTKNTNDIINLANNFFDLMKIIKAKKESDGGEDFQEIINFYEKVFLVFLSKKEIRIESFDGKIFDELSEEECGVIDVLGCLNNEKLAEGEIKTIYPGVYLRSKMLAPQKIHVYNQNIEKIK